MDTYTIIYIVLALATFVGSFFSIRNNYIEEAKRKAEELNSIGASLETFERLGESLDAEWEKNKSSIIILSVLAGCFWVLVLPVFLVLKLMRG